MGERQKDMKQIQAPPTRPGPMLMAIGPGIVVSGAVIGSGELINVPLQAAMFGFTLFWAVIISSAIKYFLQIEIGRHCLVHNYTTFQALTGCPGPKFRGVGWVGILFMVGYTLSLITVAGILGATAGLLHSLYPIANNPITSKNIWAVMTFLIAAAILWRSSYGELEKLVALLVAGFSLSVVVALFLVKPSISNIASGLTFSLGTIDRKAAAFAVISFIGALGATANDLFTYPYWILEKGYARHLGHPDTPGWTQRARGWVRVLKLDTGCATLLTTVVTAAYFLVGSEVLHQRVQSGEIEVPGGIEVVKQVSAIFTETYGPGSYGLFMFGAFCTLFSTLIVLAAGTGRMWADLFSSMGYLDRNDKQAHRRFTRIIQTLSLFAFLVIELLVTIPAEKRVILGQYINGLVNTPLIMFAICWMAFRTDRRLRMSWLTATLLLITVAVILSCLAVGLYTQGGN